jgi:hypothetical protein
MVKIKKFLAFKELKYSLITVSLGLIPVFVIILLLQLFVDIVPYHSQLKTIDLSDYYDIKMLIYYIVSAIIHLFICIIVSSYFSLSINKNTSIPKLRVMRTFRLFSLVFVFLLVYLIDGLHINLAYLSHDRIYFILSKSIFYSNSFKFFPEDFMLIGMKWFHLFSVLPFTLICVALSVMVFGGFYIGKELYNHVDSKEVSVNTLKEFVSNSNRMLRSYSQLLSVVMVSSTIATVLFFQLPVSLIKDTALRGYYSGVSMSMGVCWGATFSLTLLFLCIFPYSMIHRKIRSVIQDNRVKDDPEFEVWIEENASYFSFFGNIKLIISIVSPVVAGILTTLISHGIA